MNPPECPRCGSSEVRFDKYSNVGADEYRLYLKCLECKKAWTILRAELRENK